MVTYKTEAEIKILHEGGKILAKILRNLVKASRPGISATELNELAERLILENGTRPAFKGYRPHGRRPFPAALCVSKNSVVVHGIPKSSVVLEKGDIVTLDLGIVYKKFITDSALTIGIGRTSPQTKKLLRVTEGALEKAISVCKVGNSIGDIGSAVENFVKKHGFSVIRELVGHGVGFHVHEDPSIPNFGHPGLGEKLKPGMVLAIEPMVSMGGSGVVEAEDGSFLTNDGSLAAHFEHTVAVTKRGPLILTR